jgi:hypothetical protein
LFDQKYPETKKGLIADIRIHNGKFSCTGIMTKTKANSFYSEINETNDFGFKSTSLNNNTLKINNYVLKPISFSDSYQNRTALVAYKDEKKIWFTHPMSLISITTCKLDGENEYLFTLEQHYSDLDGEIGLRPYVYAADNKGLMAKWRGSALAWPLIDAVISPDDNKILCALHRADSFINPDSTEHQTHIAAYSWNGFGYRGVDDSITCKSCKELFSK